MTLTAAELLDACRIPPGPALFTIGTMERRLTVLSQQIRALNLIEALASVGGLRPSSTVAVVGAGAAGLTAALAADRHGAQVIVLEKGTDPMPLLSGCDHRLLHPHLYDWPDDGWMRED